LPVFVYWWAICSFNVYVSLELTGEAIHGILPVDL
jgi:hypothetical protein